MSLEELTVGELRRALASGSSEQTVAEALAALDADDELSAQHTQKIRAYEAYTQARAARLRHAVAEAVDEVDQARQRTGLPWGSDEDRARARHDAGVEAESNFLDDEPLLEFGDWLEAGEPEHYRATSPSARREARIARLVQGGK